MPAVTLHDVAPRPIVSIRQELLEAALPSFIGGAIGQLMGRLSLLGVAPAGPPFVLYHAFGPVLDAEVCVPVRREIAASGRIHGRVLPAAKLARILHVGPYETLADSYAVLRAWIGEHHLEAAGPVRETYLTGIGEGVAPEQYRTEIELPVEVVPLAVA